MLHIKEQTMKTGSVAEMGLLEPFRMVGLMKMITLLLSLTKLMAAGLLIYLLFIVNRVELCLHSRIAASKFFDGDVLSFVVGEA